MNVLHKTLTARRGLTVLGLKIAEALLAAAMTIYFARILGPASFGYFAFGLATITLLAIPIKNGASTLITKQVAIATDNSESQGAGAFLATGLRISLAYSMVPVALSWGSFLFLAPGDQFLHTVAVFSLALPFLTFTGLMEGVLRGAFRPNASILVGTVLVPGLTLLTAAATVRVGLAHGWQSASGIYVVSALAVSLIGFAMARARLFALLTGSRATRISWWHWLRVTTPFMIVTGLLVFNRQIDVILLAVIAGERDAGIYRLSAQAAVLVTFGVQAIGHLYAPHLAAAGSRGDIDAVSGYLKKSAVFSLVFGVAALALLVAVGHDLIAFLAGSDYLPGYPVMLMLCAANLAVAANGAILQAIYMQGHESRTARIFFATAVALVLTNLALIPFYGIYGAATATFLAILLWSLGLRWLACRTWGLSLITLSRTPSTRDAA